MIDETKKKMEKFGYQPKEEHRGYQPSNAEPQKTRDANDTVKSDGNIAQKK
jgi:hypothetical protein